MEGELKPLISILKKKTEINNDEIQNEILPVVIRFERSGFINS